MNRDEVRRNEWYETDYPHRRYFYRVRVLDIGRPQTVAEGVVAVRDEWNEVCLLDVAELRPIGVKQ